MCSMLGALLLGSEVDKAGLLEALLEQSAHLLARLVDVAVGLVVLAAVGEDEAYVGHEHRVVGVGELVAVVLDGGEVDGSLDDLGVVGRVLLGHGLEEGPRVLVANQLGEQLLGQLEAFVRSRIACRRGGSGRRRVHVVGGRVVEDTATCCGGFLGVERLFRRLATLAVGVDRSVAACACALAVSLVLTVYFFVLAVVVIIVVSRRGGRGRVGVFLLDFVVLFLMDVVVVVVAVVVVVVGLAVRVRLDVAHSGGVLARATASSRRRRFAVCG